MIYLDSSVVLAQLLAEDRKPASTLWEESIISSRLLEYEVWTQINARRLGPTHGDAARDLIARISFVELSPIVLARATEPFPVPVRTLDSLHLATIEYLRAQRLDVELATYDARLERAARRLKVRVRAV